MRLSKCSILNFPLSLAVTITVTTANGAQPVGRLSAETVTLDAPGWSLNHILAEVSKQTGLNLKATGTCASDYLVVRVNYVPWQVLKQKLAWIEYGKWISSAGGFTIERDSDLVQSQVNADLASRANYLAAQFAKLRPTTGSRFDANSFIDQSLAVAQKLRMATRNPKQSEPPMSPKLRTLMFNDGCFHLNKDLPMAVASKKMICNLPVHALAALAVGESVVYSTQPTRLQRPFPPAAIADYEQGLVENRELQKAVLARGIVPSTIAGPNDPLGLLHWQKFLLPDQPFGPLTIQVRRYDDGSLLITPRWYLGYDERAEYLAYIVIHSPRFSQQGKSNAPLMKISRRTVQEWREMQSDALEPLPPHLAYKLRHPQEYDPLSLTIAPFVAALPANENLIVRDDGLMSQLNHKFDLKGPNLVPSDLFYLYQRKGLCQVQSEDDWVTVRDLPNDLGEFERLPRQAYDELVSTISDSGAIPFESVLRFVKNLGPHTLQTVHLTEMLTSALTNVDVFSASSGGYKPQLFLASLNHTQWCAACSENGLWVGQLTGLPLKRLMSFLLDDTNDLVSEQDISLEGQPQRSIYDDPTVAFSRGLPPLVLKIKATREPVVIFNSSVSIGMNTEIEQRVIPVPEFAYYTNGSVSGATMETPDLSRLYLGTEDKLTVTLNFLGHLYRPTSTEIVTCSLHKHEYHNWHDFPVSVRNHIESALKQ